MTLSAARIVGYVRKKVLFIEGAHLDPCLLREVVAGEHANTMSCFYFVEQMPKNAQRDYAAYAERIRSGLPHTYPIATQS